jgi:hypothetical protein
MELLSRFDSRLLDWIHRKVLDFKFVAGRVQSVTDLSTEMAKIREQQMTGEACYQDGQGGPKET